MSLIFLEEHSDLLYLLHEPVPFGNLTIEGAVGKTGSGADSFLPLVTFLVYVVGPPGGIIQTGGRRCEHLVHLRDVELVDLAFLL